MKQSNGGFGMKIIGLTGGTGSGKGLVSQILKAHGAYIIDSDLIAHDIIQKGRPAFLELLAYFGENILGEDGEIVRRSLGEIVFRDKEKLSFLNACTHKYIKMEIATQLAYAKENPEIAYSIIDAPLLFEAGLESICDAVWVVYAKEEVRIQRIMERDGITKEHAKARVSNQKTWEEYEALSDTVIDNSQDYAHVEQQIVALLENH